MQNNIQYTIRDVNLSSMQRLSLQTRMIIYVVILVLVELVVIGEESARLLSTEQEKQLSLRALAVANSVAAMPCVISHAEKREHSEELHSLIERVRNSAAAEFIVIGDINGVRLTHPIKDNIGKSMVGGDNERALNYGESYISRATGSLGPSLRAKVPVINSEHQIVGIVSVGYLEETIAEKARPLMLQIVSVIIVLLIVGIISAIFLARSFRKAIFGLEPIEIGQLFKERSAILESMREGVVAIDIDNRITMLNRAAIRVLGLDSSRNYRHCNFPQIVPNLDYQSVLANGEPIIGAELLRAGHVLVVNCFAIGEKESISGVVFSFHKKDEIDTLGQELSQIKDYSSLLRAQTHEYSNKLHTISGLIQLGAYDEAVQLIGSETSGYQELLQLLLKTVPDPVIAGCILGKYNRAKELSIDFELDGESHFSDVPEFIDRKHLVTVLGNLLSNAFESVLKKDKTQRKVILSLVDIGNDLIIEVEDSGVGIDKSMTNKIFTRGFTTSHEQGKGVGLSLVSQALEQLNGQITVAESSLGGASFTVYIAKEPLR